MEMKEIEARITTAELSPKNKRTLRTYLEALTSENLTLPRIAKSIRYLLDAGAFLGSRSFSEAEEGDLRRLMAQVNQRDWMAWTKTDYGKVLKRFYKWHEGEGEEYPKKIRWLKPRVKRSEEIEPDILGEDEILAILKAATTDQHRALVMVLFESGARVSELVGMSIGSVAFDGNLCRVSIKKGKTGGRVVPLVRSVPYLTKWINGHPFKGDERAPLWLAFGTVNHLGRLSGHSALVLVKELGKRAGIKKRMYCHLFRHSSATLMARSLTEAEMKKFYGWEAGSTSPARYVHLSARSVEESVLRANGILKDDKKRESMLVERICSRCATANGAEAVLCTRCSSPLTIEAALKAEEKRKQMEERLGKLEELHDVLMAIPAFRDLLADPRVFEQGKNALRKRDETIKKADGDRNHDC